MAKLSYVLGAIILAIGTWFACMYLLRVTWELTKVSAFGTVAVWLSHLSIFGWIFVLVLAFVWYKVLAFLFLKNAT